MSNEEHSSAEKSAPVSIGRAFEELDDYLAENDETYRFDVDAALAGLKRAIASEQRDSAGEGIASPSNARPVARQHLDSETVAAYVDGELRMNAYLSAAQHLSVCTECAAEVDALQQRRIALRRAGLAESSAPETTDATPAGSPAADSAITASDAGFGNVALAVKVSSDIVTVRRAARDLARELGFSHTDIAMISTAISEIARNITSFASAVKSGCSPTAERAAKRS